MRMSASAVDLAGCDEGWEPTLARCAPPSRRYGHLQGEDPPKRAFCTVTWPESEQSSSDDEKDAFDRGNLRGRQGPPRALSQPV
jgi:hypothetical protein